MAGMNPAMFMLPSMISPIPQYGNVQQTQQSVLGNMGQLQQGGQQNQQTYDLFSGGQTTPQMTGPTGYDPAQTTQYGNWLTQQFQPLVGEGQQVYNMGMDPQQALYNRTQQQLQDQTRAAEAARGISMSPYGAGVEGNVMSNFNIDWQNQQLQRALAGLQGQRGALESAGQGIAGGQGLAMAGPEFQQSTLSNLIGAQNAGLQPYQSAAGIGLQYSQQAQQAAQAKQQAMLQALGLASGQQQSNQAAQNAQNAGLGSLFGAGLGALTSPYAGTSALG